MGRTLILVLLLSLLCVGAAIADVADVFRQMFATASREPHPSIVQVLAPDREAISRGSGTLIHVDGHFGYVITNWHVVRDAEREVLVIFPDGYQSLARILKMNKDWDLALLLIWAGNERPMPLAAVGPRPGDELQIAGYGSGDFRAQRGYFSTFAAPQPDMPFEMFEVRATARQGDSGGPIMNQRGELVGVLFGAGDGRTTGTQIGRVRMFVNEAFDDLRNRAASIAQQSPNTDGRPAAHPATQELASQTVTAVSDVPAATAANAVPIPPSPAMADLLAGAAGAGPSLVTAGPFAAETTSPPPPAQFAQRDRIDSRVAVAPSGSKQVPAAIRGSVPARVAEAEPNGPSTRSVPAPSEDAWRAYQNSASESIAGNGPTDRGLAQNDGRADRSTATPPRQIRSNAGQRGQELARDEPAAEGSRRESVMAARRARPAEVSRRDLVAPDGFNRAARDQPATAAIGPGSASRTGQPVDFQGLPQRVTVPRISGGVTWDQIRSFFAAVGVFAVLHALVKTFGLSPTSKRRRAKSS